MTDFIEYVVSELKSKRLSKVNALSLIKQFSVKAQSKASTQHTLHPLLHSNTSNFAQQSYTTQFSGDEQFLKDHVIYGDKILPGAAYLEMARAAYFEAAGYALEERDNTFIEISNVVWTRPIVVDRPKIITIALFLPITQNMGDNDFDAEFEVYSLSASDKNDVNDVIHCTGELKIFSQDRPVNGDPIHLKERPNRVSIVSEDIYKAYSELGVSYGPTHRGIQRIDKIDKELLVEINCPSELSNSDQHFILNPGLLDAALQSPIGFLEDISSLPENTLVPYSVARVRVFSQITDKSFVYVRFSDGDEGNISSLDLDILDEKGNVCVQIHKFVSKEIQRPRALLTVDTVYAQPQWVAEALPSISGDAVTTETVNACTILVGKNDFIKQQSQGLNHSIALVSVSEEKTLAENYSKISVRVFEEIQSILKNKSKKNQLLQLVVERQSLQQQLYAGLGGLVKTANRENPNLALQLIGVDSDLTNEDLERILVSEQRFPKTKLIDYSALKRSVYGLKPIELNEIENTENIETPLIRDTGIYVITGGLGGIGQIFAQEILSCSDRSIVVLTGRAPFDPKIEALLKKISPSERRLAYVQCNLTDTLNVEARLTEITKTYGAINGIIHAAGMINDNFIINKTSQEFVSVLEPKVTGTFNLDLASQGLDLDFLVLFSAGASLMGNNGQADYSCANGFLDEFSKIRNRWVTEGKRRGHTLTINWPLWKNGGMKVDATTEQVLFEHSGMMPMLSDAGISAFYAGLRSTKDQLFVVQGNGEKLQQTLFETHSIKQDSKGDVNSPESPKSARNTVASQESVVAYLKKRLSDQLRMSPQKIAANAAFEKFGIDSIMMMNLTSRLEQDFGTLPKTLFFEYHTITELAAYIVSSHGEKLAFLLDNKPQTNSKTEDIKAQSLAYHDAITPAVVKKHRNTVSRFKASQSLSQNAEPIAIIGLSGRYPQAWDIDEYWNNLRDGRDSITEVPKDRWNWRDFFTSDRTQAGKHFSKWGGFIDGVDEFDPRFFSIPPSEAALVEPQERLFLQQAWMAIEDAGETRASMRMPHRDDLDGQVGVYVGLMYSEYQMFGAERVAQGNPLGVPGSYASVANRVSYLMNLHGPSMTVDTMCSSSLTAIHLACQDLKLGRTDMAIAGAVNLSIHPNKYLVISAGQFISSDGHCQSFGVGGDGYIPGEGVGAVVLKRLSEAQRDGNHIYGIIRGSALNHGGKTSGYSVPNPRAQSSVIHQALVDGKIDPRHISYLEAHGTGTKLGDPIEIAALTQAFERSTSDKGFCRIGSAKSNIGHCESAAGIAGLTKVLMQMRYRKIVPSLHSSVLNPHIDFESTPFVVNQDLCDWPRPHINGNEVPRIAGISSFGAGGSNSHLIVEEYVDEKSEQLPLARLDLNREVLLLLSARTQQQLQTKASDLKRFVAQAQEPLDLRSLAFTLQVGREAMDVRLALLVSSIEELIDKLSVYLDEQQSDRVYTGAAYQQQDSLGALRDDPDFLDTVEKWIINCKFDRLAELWVNGHDIDWQKTWQGVKPQRISLPAYPFAREKYWVERTQTANKTKNKTGLEIHPFLHANNSSLGEQVYISEFSASDIVLQHHQVAIEESTRMPVLPGVVYLEIVNAAVKHAIPDLEEGMRILIKDVVWQRPFVVDLAKTIQIQVWGIDNDAVGFEIYSFGEGGEPEGDSSQKCIHCSGIVEFDSVNELRAVDIQELESNCQIETLGRKEIYDIFSNIGIHYGEYFQSLTKFNKGVGQVISHIKLPDGYESELGSLTIHPALVDGALQSSLGMLDKPEALSSSDAPLPFAMDSFEYLHPCEKEMIAWVRPSLAKSASEQIIKLDIDLITTRGDVCVQIVGYSSRAKNQSTLHSAAYIETNDLYLAKPVWQPLSVATSRNADESHDITKLIISTLQDKSVTETLRQQLPNAKIIDYQFSGDDCLDDYKQLALGCFAEVKKQLSTRNSSINEIRLVVGEAENADLGAGISALLATAAQENHKIKQQCVICSPKFELAVLIKLLKGHVASAYVKLKGAQSFERKWHTLPTSNQDFTPFKENGCYVITGGLGALGQIFAKQIIKQTTKATLVLTGRKALNKDQQALLTELGNNGHVVTYRQINLSDGEQVNAVIAELEQQYRGINGIIHSAGMTDDGLIVNKNKAKFLSVLSPKVAGTLNLDKASEYLLLDFFALFSSTSSVLGNAGQADYAVANSFMDQFALYRNTLRDQGKRSGHSISFNWPLWKNGGMRVDASIVENMAKAFGVSPLENEKGLSAFYGGLKSGAAQVFVAQGAASRIDALLNVRSEHANTKVLPLTKNTPVPVVEAEVATNNDNLSQKALELVKKIVADDLQLLPSELQEKVPLENYGMDSVLAMRLTNTLEASFGPLSKTLFFEYQTLAALAGFLAKAFPNMFVKPDETAIKTAISQAASDNSPARRPLNIPTKGTRVTARTKAKNEEVAIVGVSGRYPQAESLAEFWQNLCAGKDCIEEIPSERWRESTYFDPERNRTGKTYSKWGGFLKNVDKFDPLFFSISPKEAELMDPQERLFLETVWHTIEDAGYRKETLEGNKVGIYVGAMWSQYQLFGADPAVYTNTQVPNSSFASIANRVSYFFNFHGPSLAIDTMCSSSLTAIHLAAEEIRKGNIPLAIAGGVNLSLHPNKYLNLSQGNFASSDGKCRSFGDGGDGYVPGEGVGAVMLKPLEQAIADNDRIYATIKSSSINHGGKTNGYTVPNPNAQAELIVESLKKAKVAPESLSYVEAHGTGTSLGDPIEITGLTKAFEKYHEENPASSSTWSCALGSVKSNIGHLEAAAGIAGLTKVLLQLKHKKLVPSLHVETLNSNIDFNNSPFCVQTAMAEWTPNGEHPLRACVSSFGAGGANAHVILEEYTGTPATSFGVETNSPNVFLLSARDQAGTLRQVNRMLAYLENAGDVDFSELAYSSQLGRTAMADRLAISTNSIKGLIAALEHWRSQETDNNIGISSSKAVQSNFEIGYGNTKNADQGSRQLIAGEAGRALLDVVIQERDFRRLSQLWISGVEIDWQKLYSKPISRISLPHYSFAKERYWVEGVEISSAPSELSVNDSVTASVDLKYSLYKTNWIHTPYTNTEESFAHTVVIIGASDNFIQTLKEHASFKNSNIIQWQTSREYTHHNDEFFTLDLTNTEHLERVFSHLESIQKIPASVVYIGQATELNASDLAASKPLNYDFDRLFILSQILQKHIGASKIQLLVLSESGDLGNIPQLSGLGAFFKTLNAETPKISGKVIEIIESVRGINMPELLTFELLDEVNEYTNIRYSADENGVYTRFGKGLSPIEESLGQVAETQLLPIKQGGIYLLSGGLGGLGSLFAQYMAEKYSANLVLFGRSSANERHKLLLADLAANAESVSYHQVDVSDYSDVEQLIEKTISKFGRIDGVLHSAGSHDDAFLANKTLASTRKVLLPKLEGTYNLDRATCDLDLDLFVTFSSVAGITGNIGQADYAFANSFMDSFAALRSSLVNQNLRSGKTLSINWPLWIDGGMTIDASDVELMKHTRGIHPLPTEIGLQCWETVLGMDLPQALVLYGEAAKLTSLIQKQSANESSARRTTKFTNGELLHESTRRYLQQLIADEIKLEASRVMEKERFDAFGIDSVVIGKLNARMESDLGDISKTLFYECESVIELADYLIANKKSELATLFGAVEVEPSIENDKLSDVAIIPLPQVSVPDSDNNGEADEYEPIAIIGIDGRYPQSRDLNEFWKHLKKGKHLVSEVPKNRWDADSLYDPDPEKAKDGKIYCKWGGFIEDHDKFDAEFFNISATDAEKIDPQERLVLQSVWSAIEDSGHTRAQLKAKYPKGKSADVGVFIGVTTNTYHLLGAQEWEKGNLVTPASMPWSIANRVSYFFDFQGPSMPIDTACSSSLVAIDMACENLRKTRCQLAVVGGVNLYLHPAKYQAFCNSEMLSQKGVTHSYGQGADGFVPAEGVGTLILKPLSKALADGDNIHGVIRGSSYDHSGRSNGYSAPNPNSQASVIRAALTRSAVDAASIGYVEGHGTGTKMGDGLEVAAISNAFKTQTNNTGYCAIGSLKANMGHPEATAGVAGITKVLMQFKNKQIPPSINCSEENDSINFQSSPVYIQRELTHWEVKVGAPRRALVNGFGSGGVNACVVLEEFDSSIEVKQKTEETPQLIVLSARNEAGLREYANKLLTYVGRERGLELSRLAYTLQNYREEMSHRLAFIASTSKELIKLLNEWRSDKSSKNIILGTVGSSVDPLDDATYKDVYKLAQNWVIGKRVDWLRLYGQKVPKKLSVPTYPFAKDRCWIKQARTPERIVSNVSHTLHPLVTSNISTLNAVRFSSTLERAAYYGDEHRVQGQPVLPGACFLEIACAAANLAGEGKVVNIRDIVWLSPYVFNQDVGSLQTHLQKVGEDTEFSISSIDEMGDIGVHAEGKVTYQPLWNSASGETTSIDIAKLKKECSRRSSQKEIYSKFNEYGFDYGVSFQSITSLASSQEKVLAEINLPQKLYADYHDYILHPVILDAAFQAVSGLVGSSSEVSASIPFAIDELVVSGVVPKNCYVLIEKDSPSSSSELMKFNIRLVTHSGTVVVAIKNFCVRPIKTIATVEPVSTS